MSARRLLAASVPTTANASRRKIGVPLSPDLTAVLLSAKLAALSTGLLLILGRPIAWWLAWGRSPLKTVVGAIVTLPLVLMGPQGPVGHATQALGLGLLPFTFPGLVVASVICSMPFVVQPLQQAFAALGAQPLEAAVTLRASPWDAFFTVALPLARPGFVTAAVLGFAHTVGEFER
jgi:molybdate transport system permease protein